VCRREAPAVARVSQQNPEVTFIGIAAQDNEGAMASFVDATGVGVFEHVNDGQGQIWARYGVTYQPAFVVLSADGSVGTYGALGESELQGLIDEL